MPKLENYNQFQGLHWETGSIRNYYDYCGVKAPHTGQPYTEAMLMGISGGAVMGYFSFAYEGYDPLVSILTRNTFDPMNTLLERLGVVQEIRHTSKSDKAVTNLIDTLQDGTPAIVWADIISLPYNAIPHDDGWWAMMPIVVYGYDEREDCVWIADRARAPLTVSVDELATARGRIKKDKFRILTLDRPDPDKFATAVQMGIWDCIKLYTEKPPRGSKNNFGFAAYQRWADLLTKPRQKLSWAKEFPPGRKMYAGLTTAFNHVATFGKDGNAERDVYADFLDEASIVLNKPALKDVAVQFRISAQAWHELGNALLPDDVPLLGETRALKLRKHRLFLDQGGDALTEIQQINERLDEIKERVSTDFPLDETGVTSFCENLREQILKIHDIEHEAIDLLKSAMS